MSEHVRTLCFAYVANDPVNMIDPTGMEIEDRTRITIRKYGLHGYIVFTDMRTGKGHALRGGPTRGIGSSRGSSGSTSGTSSASTGSTSGSGSSGTSSSSSSGSSTGSGGIVTGEPGNPIIVDSSPVYENVDTAVFDVGTPGGEGVLYSRVFDGNFQEYVDKANAFADSVNNAKIGYKLLERNSNSTMGTGFEYTTGLSRPELDANLPGYDRDLCSRDNAC